MSATLCQCGCGLPAPIAPRTDARKGWVKGEPRPWRQGHAIRAYAASRPYYVVEDRGFASPCWIWQRALSSGGYGRMHLGSRTLQAHRVFYERVHGPIPDGLQLDHLCRNRACINPEHLEPVTPSENGKRGLRGQLRTPPTHCKAGHPYTPANTRVTPKGALKCRACHRRDAAASRNRRKARG